MMVEVCMVIYFQKVRFPYPTLVFPHLKIQKGSLKVKAKNQITVTTETVFFFYIFMLYILYPEKRNFLLRNIISVCMLDIFKCFLVILFRVRLFLSGLPCSS